jgi:DNA-binding response OmpR family regulator
LLVDDEIELGNMIQDYMLNEGFDVQVEHSFSKGKEAFDNASFQAVILDINLPDGSGLDLCKYMRDASDVPIVMLSAKSGDVDKIMGLGVGSDDYMTKPFSASELSARVRAHISRHKRLSNGQVKHAKRKQFHDLIIDESAYEVFLKGDKINVTAKEFEILNFLASNPHQVFRKEQVFHHVWGYDDFGDFSTVTVHIRKLREKIEEHPKKPRYIITVWGVGYKFENPE